MISPAMRKAMMVMKMQSKKMERNVRNLKKEEKKNLKKAEEQLKKGDEEIARIYIDNSLANRQGYLKQLKLSQNMNGLQERIKLNDATNKTVEDVNKKALPYFKEETSDKRMDKVYRDNIELKNVNTTNMAFRKLFNKKIDQIAPTTGMDKDGEAVLEKIKQKHIKQLNKKDKHRTHKPVKISNNHVQKVKMNSQ